MVNILIKNEACVILSIIIVWGGIYMGRPNGSGRLPALLDTFRARLSFVRPGPSIATSALKCGSNHPSGHILVHAYAE